MIFDILFFAVSAIIIFVVYKIIFKPKSKPEASKEDKKEEVQERRQPNPEPVVPNRNPNVRNRFNVARNVNLNANEEEERKIDEEEQDEPDDENNPLDKSKKSLQKEAKRQAKKEQQEAFKQMLEAKEKKDTEKRSKYEERERQREEEERKREEERIKLEEELKRKEEEEYNKWRNLFSVEEAGREVDNLEKEENLIKKFVDYIKLRKVVELEDVSADFRMPTKDVVDRLQKLLESKQLTGIIDDRGKFIYITDAEFMVNQTNYAQWKAVANLIKKRGRIGKADLTHECNKLIKLDPSAADKEKIKKEQAKMLEQIESELKSVNDNPAQIYN